MSAKKIAVGIIGGIILLGGYIAIMYYGNVDAEDSAIEGNPILGEIKTGLLSPETRSGVDGDTITITKEIDVEYLEKIQFKLSWTDDEPYISGADTLTMKIYAPSRANVQFDSGQETSGTSSPIILNVNVNDLSGLKSGTTDNGAGGWRIEITVSSTGILPLPIDSGNDWTLDVSYTYMELEG